MSGRLRSCGNAIRAGPGWAALGRRLAWGQGLAALLDWVENIALLVVLLEAPVAPWPQVAWGCAVPKFGLVALGLCYVAAGAVRRRL